tara:strand:+ start:1008 stop:1196 length:189 start_codon:yes stop_codon:yes gene_type:complete
MHRPLRHIVGWSGLIFIISLLAVFMSFFFNLSGYNINARWILIPCLALTVFLIPKINDWVKK